MIKNIEKIYDDIFNGIKEYLGENSIYNPYVSKREPEKKYLPLVVVKQLYNNARYTTLKWTDEIYYQDLEINVYAVQNGKISNMTICNEITDHIVDYLKENYTITTKIGYDCYNIDTNVYRNTLNLSYKIETKYDGLLVISPNFSNSARLNLK